MASSARIDELQKKFAENPRRFFAPLADEYRKAGDLPAAIELCRAHLAQQPGHMSGHIVLGKALYEAGEHDEAQQVFETALGLDPENLIALRHLGDIARQQGDARMARAWYQRVLDADPRNEEIAALLRDLDEVRSPHAPTPAWSDATPQGWVDPDPAGTTVELEPPTWEAVPDTIAEDTTPDGSLPPAVEPSALAYLAHAGETTADTEPLDLPAGDFSLDMPETVPVGPAATAPAPRDASAADDEFGGDFGSFGEAPAAPPVHHDTPVIDLGTPLVPMAAIPEPPAPPAPAAAADAARDIGFESMEFQPPARDEVARAEGLERGQFDFDPHVVDGSVDRSEPTPGAFVTETMAELYEQQGFHDEALAVYRQLLTQNPDDANLRDRIRRLESGGRGSSAFEVSEDVVRAAQERRSRATRRTARAFFASLAARRAPGREDAWDAAPAAAAGAWGSPVDEAPHAHGDHADAAPDAPTHGSQPGYPSWDAAGAEMGTGFATPTSADALADAPAYDAPAYDAPAYDAPAYDTTWSGDASTDVAPSYDAVPDTIAEDTTPDGTLPPAVEPSALAWLAEQQEPVADAASGATPAEAYDAVAYEVGGLETTAWTSVSEPGAAPASPAVPAAPAVPGAPAAPGGGSLDALFGGATAADDEAAAAALAGVFGAKAPTPPAVRPAASELSLDHVFRETPRRADAQRRDSSSFSFDQFFSEGPGADQPPASSTTPAAPTEGQPEGPADIEQFTAWLEGLKKK